MPNNRIVKVYVSYGETVNMGNYESLRLDYGMEVDTSGIDENDILPLMDKIRVSLRKRTRKAIEEENAAWDR